MGEFWNDKRVALVARMALLAAIIGFGIFLRVHDINVSLYDDEISTRERALQSARFTVETRNYPLYYLLAKGSLAFGDTEAALRLPSLIAGLLSLVAAYVIVSRIHSRTAGLVAAAVIAFSPFHINYSTFARYYALLMFFALLTLWCLYGILERGRFRDWFGYTVSAFLALSSHICFAPALAFMNIMAALYLLCCRAKGPFRRRAGLVCLLAICTCAASSLLIQKNLHPARFFTWSGKANTAQSAAPAPEISDAPATAAPVASAGTERPRGGGLAFTDSATGKTLYRLTFYDCLEYLKTYFWNDTNWLWPLLLVLGVWGFADLWFRVPALAAPLTGGLVLGPVCLFFVSSAHWYHARYLSYTYLFAVILVACGACVLPRFLARAIAAPRSIGLWRRKAAPQDDRDISLKNLIYSGLVFGLALPLIPVQNTAYNTYPVDGYLPRGPLVLNKVPIRDWKNLHRFTAETVRDGDVFHYMTPEIEHGDNYTRYYLSRFLPWHEDEHHIDQSFGAPTPNLIQQLAVEKPFSNLWFVGYENYNARDFADFFSDAGAAHYNFSFLNVPRGLRLFVLGAPTTNHVANGDFEGRTKGDQPKGISKTAENPYAGSLALLVEVEPADVQGKEVWQTMFRTPVSPASYRLRNNSFEAWKEGAPVGWNANSARSISMTEEGHEASRGLKFAPSQETVVVQQVTEIATAPGRTLEVQAMGLSSTAENLQLVLRYSGPGFQEEVHASHPGDGKWVQMHLEANIPANTDPRSITVEVWRLAGGEGDAMVDTVEMKVKDLGGTLDPATPYVLSLAVRSENLAHKSGSDRVPAGRVRLAWVDAEGKTGTTDLMNVRQHPSWQKISAPVRPGIDFPSDLRELYLEIGIVDGTGTLVFDDLQLEEGTQPTLFTESFRLPHDEALAGRDLSKHVVAVGWQVPPEP